MLHGSCRNYVGNIKSRTIYPCIFKVSLQKSLPNSMSPSFTAETNNWDFLPWHFNAQCLAKWIVYVYKVLCLCCADLYQDQESCDLWLKIFTFSAQRLSVEPASSAAVGCGCLWFAVLARPIRWSILGIREEIDHIDDFISFLLLCKGFCAFIFNPKPWKADI